MRNIAEHVRYAEANQIFIQIVFAQNYSYYKRKIAFGFPYRFMNYDVILLQKIKVNNK
jgi:hypothetical protein